LIEVEEGQKSCSTSFFRRPAFYLFSRGTMPDLREPIEDLDASEQADLPFFFFFFPGESPRAVESTIFSIDAGTSRSHGNEPCSMGYPWATRHAGRANWYGAVALSQPTRSSTCAPCLTTLVFVTLPPDVRVIIPQRTRAGICHVVLCLQSSCGFSVWANNLRSIRPGPVWPIRASFAVFLFCIQRP